MNVIADDELPVVIVPKEYDPLPLAMEVEACFTLISGAGVQVKLILSIKALPADVAITRVEPAVTVLNVKVFVSKEELDITAEYVAF